MLRGVPELTALNLTFSSFCINDEFLECFRYDAAGTPLLAPKLDVLTWSAIGILFYEETLERTIRSRWWTDSQYLAMPSPPRVARLKRMIVSREPWALNRFSVELKDRMRDAVEQGLDLDFTSKNARSMF